MKLCRLCRTRLEESWALRLATPYDRTADLMALLLLQEHVSKCATLKRQCGETTLGDIYERHNRRHRDTEQQQIYRKAQGSFRSMPSAPYRVNGVTDVVPTQRQG